MMTWIYNSTLKEHSITNDMKEGIHLPGFHSFATIKFPEFPDQFFIKFQVHYHD